MLHRKIAWLLKYKREKYKRVIGRIAEAPIAFDAKFRMIVPPKHYVAQLLVASFHHKLLHAGQNHILAHLREKFWIPNERSAVRKVVRSCVTCKKQRAAAMEQLMSRASHIQEWTTLAL